MKKSLVLAVCAMSVIGLSACQTTTTGDAVSASCEAPQRESERLLCRADVVQQQRWQASTGGLVVGAIVGGLVAQAVGEDARRGAAIGGGLGALAGYWGSVAEQRKLERMSKSEARRELAALEAAERRRLEESAARLSREFEQAWDTADPAERDARLDRVARAAQVGQQDAQNQRDGINGLADRMGLDGRPGDGMAQPFTMMSRLKEKSCDAMFQTNQYCRV